MPPVIKQKDFTIIYRQIVYSSNPFSTVLTFRTVHVINLTTVKLLSGDKLSLGSNKTHGNYSKNKNPSVNNRGILDYKE